MRLGSHTAEERALKRQGPGVDYWATPLDGGHCRLDLVTERDRESIGVFRHMKNCHMREGLELLFAASQR